jgi:peptide deformylase
MAKILQISQLGHPVLLNRAQAVEDLMNPAIQSLIDDMIVTVIDANGVGLAAPQVYEPKRIIVLASRPNPRYPEAPEMEPTAMVNPEILWRSEEMAKGWEGCLSAPGIRALVPRYEELTFRYLTRAGEQVEEACTDFIARIVQHECDHLDGISFLERVDNPREIVMEKEFMRIIMEKGCSGHE